MENAKNQDKGLIFQERFNELVGNSTQEEIAQKLNTSRQNVGNWKKGKSRPDIFALAEISKAYNVSTDYLLGLTDIKSTDTTVQDICEYTGLNEKAIHCLNEFCLGTKKEMKDATFLLKRYDCNSDFVSQAVNNSELNYLITSGAIFEISLLLKIIQMTSLTLFETTTRSTETLYKFDEQCNLSRYTLTEYVMALMDKFDERHKSPKKYKDLHTKLRDTLNSKSTAFDELIKNLEK